MRRSPNNLSKCELGARRIAGNMAEKAALLVMALVVVKHEKAVECLKYSQLPNASAEA